MRSARRNEYYALGCRNTNVVEVGVVVVVVVVAVVVLVYN